MTGNTLVDILAGWVFAALPFALCAVGVLHANRRAANVADDRRGAVAIGGNNARPGLQTPRRSGPASMNVRAGVASSHRCASRADNSVRQAPQH